MFYWKKVSWKYILCIRKKWFLIKSTQTKTDYEPPRKKIYIKSI